MDNKLYVILSSDRSKDGIQIHYNSGEKKVGKIYPSIPLRLIPNSIQVIFPVNAIFPFLPHAIPDSVPIIDDSVHCRLAIRVSECSKRRRTQRIGPHALLRFWRRGWKRSLRVKEEAHRVDERHDAVVGVGWSPLAFEMADRALSGDPTTIYFPAAPLQCERNLG
ncbi:hypothetical protein TNCV_947711 [Trichonephila clavipes]|nr:hypothetical protein TNCV_947711 [Trichonephila clavipes]